MPKKKDDTAKPQKSGGSPKPKKKNKQPSAELPRQIAGVTIGKDLRAAVEPVLRFASHPMVSETLAAALLAGASALSEKKGGKESGKGQALASTVVKLGGKGKGPVGLMLAVAAGEIASRIVAAYDVGSGDAEPERRSSEDDRRSGSGDRRAGADRRSGEDRRAKDGSVAGVERRSEDRRAQERRGGSNSRRSGASERRK